MAGISVTEPMGKAWERMLLICFRPFNLGFWFALGFCAWLAYLAEGGGSNFHVPTGGGGGGGGGGSTSSPGEIFHEGLRWVQSHLAIVLGLGTLVAVLLLALFLVIQWLRARGQFMFLDGIARNNRTNVVAGPWKEYGREANSFFIYQTLIMLIAGVLNLLALGLCLAIAWADICEEVFGAGAITAIILGVMLVPAVMIASMVLLACNTSFVLPIMYARRSSFGPAWREFWTCVFPGHAGSVLLFFLMLLLLNIAAAIVGIIAVCGTCCLAALPYLGTVVMLPVLVFLRSYSVYFLQQFGPQYTIMVESAPLSYGFPVIPLEQPMPPAWAPPSPANPSPDQPPTAP